MLVCGSCTEEEEVVPEVLAVVVATVCGVDFVRLAFGFRCEKSVEPVDFEGEVECWQKLLLLCAFREFVEIGAEVVE